MPSVPCAKKEKRTVCVGESRYSFDPLEADGIIRIEKYQNSWRILPSDSHIGRYRALNKNVY